MYLMAAAKKSFSKGDVVQLKSGGPKMTISGTKTVHGMLPCTWFKGASRESGNFDPETIVLVPEPAAKS